MAFSTSKSLLSKIGHGDKIGWEDFYRAYAPLIWLRGGDRNLRHEEKKDLIQEVMLSVFGIAPSFKYDPGKGRFRDFLRTVIDRRAFDILRKRDRAQESLEDLPPFSEPVVQDDHKWDLEWEEQIKKEALAELRSAIEPNTYQAFELYAIEKWSALETAKFTGLSLNSVYVAKSRAMEKLKSIIKELSKQ